MTQPGPTVDQLVCGCMAAVEHWPTCGLGEAERVVLAAVASSDGGPLILVAMRALLDARLLSDINAHGDDLLEWLDALWETGLIVETTEPAPTEPAP